MVHPNQFVVFFSEFSFFSSRWFVLLFFLIHIFQNYIRVCDAPITKVAIDAEEKEIVRLFRVSPK